jgi:acetyltransferase-like isoleucine patch superfamily enzyme
MVDYGREYERVQIELAGVLKKKHDRILPLDEMLSDRWKKAELLGFGEGTSVYENVYVYGSPKVGKNVWVGPFVILDATGGLEIGDGCEIGCGVMIFSHSTHLRCVSEGKVGNIHKPVIVQNYVYVGSGATVLPGVTLGHHSVVGVGAVVTKDVQPFSVVTGIPARAVGKVITSGNDVKIEYYDSK